VKKLRLICPNPQVDISVEMGDGPSTPTAGFAGWEVTDRENGKGITERVGLQPFQQDVPIFLNGYAQDHSIERQLTEILSLGDEDAEPFKAFGPIDRSGIKYVFGGEPDFGEVIKDDDGDRLRQRVTLKLMEYVRPDVVKERRKKKHHQRMGVGEAQALTYTTKQGDTLARIAQKLLGDLRRWREIGDKNGIHDPFKVLKPGLVLKL
jgi:hypothetical protein